VPVVTLLLADFDLNSDLSPGKIKCCLFTYPETGPIYYNRLPLFVFNIPDINYPSVIIDRNNVLMDPGREQFFPVSYRGQEITIPGYRYVDPNGFLANATCILIDPLRLEGPSLGIPSLTTQALGCIALANNPRIGSLLD
jgi:hypothetical protein